MGSKKLKTKKLSTQEVWPIIEIFHKFNLPDEVGVCGDMLSDSGFPEVGEVFVQLDEYKSGLTQSILYAVIHGLRIYDSDLDSNSKWQWGGMTKCKDLLNQISNHYKQPCTFCHGDGMINGFAEMDAFICRYCNAGKIRAWIP